VWSLTSLSLLSSPNLLPITPPSFFCHASSSSLFLASLLFILSYSTHLPPPSLIHFPQFSSFHTLPYFSPLAPILLLSPLPHSSSLLLFLSVPSFTSLPFSLLLLSLSPLSPSLSSSSLIHLSPILSPPALFQLLC
jgi:hypothetical protein